MNAPLAAPVSEETAEHVSFALGGECYGIDIQRVQEIKGWEPATRIPRTPAFILGVINLRGNIVPIIDLRLRFGLAEVPYDSATVIVIVRAGSERGQRTVGLVVDAVDEVFDIPAGRIQRAPPLSGAIDELFVKGMADEDGRMVILLDVEPLVNTCIGEH